MHDPHLKKTATITFPRLRPTKLDRSVLFIRHPLTALVLRVITSEDLSHSHSQPESAHCRAKASAWARHLVLLLLSLLQIERGSLAQNLRMSSSHCTLGLPLFFLPILGVQSRSLLSIGCHFVLQCGLPISTCSFLFLA